MLRRELKSSQIVEVGSSTSMLRRRPKSSHVVEVGGSASMLWCELKSSRVCRSGRSLTLARSFHHRFCLFEACITLCTRCMYAWALTCMYIDLYLSFCQLFNLVLRPVLEASAELSMQIDHARRPFIKMLPSTLIGACSSRPQVVAVSRYKPADPSKSNP
jgi:hypothetical protein